MKDFLYLFLSENLHCGSTLFLECALPLDRSTQVLDYIFFLQIYKDFSKCYSSVKINPIVSPPYLRRSWIEKTWMYTIFGSLYSSWVSKYRSGQCTRLSTLRPGLIHGTDSDCMWKGMVVALLDTWVFFGQSGFLPHQWPSRSYIHADKRYQNKL